MGQRVPSLGDCEGRAPLSMAVDSRPVASCSSSVPQVPCVKTHPPTPPRHGITVHRPSFAVTASGPSLWGPSLPPRRAGPCTERAGRGARCAACSVHTGPRLPARVAPGVNACPRGAGASRPPGAARRRKQGRQRKGLVATSPGLAPGDVLFRGLCSHWETSWHFQINAMSLKETEESVGRLRCPSSPTPPHQLDARPMGDGAAAAPGGQTHGRCS